MSPKFVQFPVPADRIADVAVFLYGQGAAPASGPEAQPDGGEGAEVGMSDEQRNELLTRIYAESEPPFRALLMLLAEREDPEARLYYGDILAAHPDWSASRSVAGAMGAYARRAVHRYGGYWPFARGWDGEQWSHYLTMDGDVAAYLRELHDDRGLALTR